MLKEEFYSLKLVYKVIQQAKRDYGMESGLEHLVSLGLGFSVNPGLFES